MREINQDAVDRDNLRKRWQSLQIKRKGSLYGKSTQLKNLLNSNDMLVMPDAYDPISAKIIEYVGFKAVQCSGYSFSISKCYQSELDVPLTENLSITKSIVNAVNIPVMADGEDGFGDGEELAGNIRSYIKIGVAGINIENAIGFFNDHQRFRRIR